MVINGQVTVNENIEKKNYRVQEDDAIEITLSPEKPKLDLEAINEPLNIVFEDDNLVIINKDPFLSVHPDNKVSHKKTLINLLLGNKIPLSPLGGENRPGIVHRLDMDTSGLIIVAKTNAGYKHMRKVFEEREIEKKYLCLCEGEFESTQGLIRAPISRNPLDRKKMSVQATKNAKNALSEFTVLETFYWKEAEKFLSLVEVNILTGRTHQIRVHFSSIKHPLIHDTTYGNFKLNKLAKLHGLKRQFLHAHKLKFKNLDNKEINITSELPDDLKEFLQNCKTEPTANETND
jgi:23S rRNA pseudouridine1911/1915/1917 synthase